jgi:hypothetical protein
MAEGVADDPFLLDGGVEDRLAAYELMADGILALDRAAH